MYNHRLVFTYKIKVWEEFKSKFNSEFLVGILHFQRSRIKKFMHLTLYFAMS